MAPNNTQERPNPASQGRGVLLLLARCVLYGDDKRIGLTPCCSSVQPAAEDVVPDLLVLDLLSQFIVGGAGDQMGDGGERSGPWR